MLQDQYRESSKIENEYKKLLHAWNIELSSKPSTDIKKSKISKSEHVQFTLMHLFNGYLDQIWTDSQNMLQCAQAWTSQNTEIYPSDAIFTMNILGLHLMKQSLRTRQEFFRIVDELNDISSINNDENGSLFSSSDSTISQDFLIEKSDFKHEYVDLDKHSMESDDTLNRSQPRFSYFDSCDQLKNNPYESVNSSIQSEFTHNNRPIKLISSPSTPTICNNWSKAPACAQDFAPTCNYDVYFPRNEGADDTHKLSCHFCLEPLLLKKSLSFNNLYSLQQMTVDSTDDEEGYMDDCSSFEIASYYYNTESDDEEDRIERELLLEKPSIAINEKYRNKGLPHGSSKIEINCSNSKSSSIIHYDVETKKIKKNKLKRYKQIAHEEYDSSSTNLPHLPYSSIYNSCFDLENIEPSFSVLHQVEQGKTSTNKDVEQSTSRLFQTNKLASFIKSKKTKNWKKKADIDDNTIPFKQFRKFALSGKLFSLKRYNNKTTHY